MCVKVKDWLVTPFLRPWYHTLELWGFLDNCTMQLSHSAYRYIPIRQLSFHFKVNLVAILVNVHLGISFEGEMEMVVAFNLGAVQWELTRVTKYGHHLSVKDAEVYHQSVKTVISSHSFYPVFTTFLPEPWMPYMFPVYLYLQDRNCLTVQLSEQSFSLCLQIKTNLSSPPSHFLQMPPLRICAVALLPSMLEIAFRRLFNSLSTGYED